MSDQQILQLLGEILQRLPPRNIVRELVPLIGRRSKEPVKFTIAELLDVGEPLLDGYTARDIGEQLSGAKAATFDGYKLTVDPKKDHGKVIWVVTRVN